jgi:hypothetical protein
MITPQGAQNGVRLIRQEQACRQSSNLRVYVGEVRQQRPPPHPHYGTIQGSTELQGHGTTSTETMGRDAIEGVPFKKKPS